MFIAVYHKNYSTFREAKKDGALYKYHTDYDKGYAIRELMTAIWVGLDATGMDKDYKVVLVGHIEGIGLAEINEQTVR